MNNQPNNERQQVYGVLSKMGLVEMPYEEFAQLPEEQVQSMAQKAMQIAEQQKAGGASQQQMQSQQAPMMQDGGSTEETPTEVAGEEVTADQGIIPGGTGAQLAGKIATSAIPTVAGAVGSSMIDESAPDKAGTKAGTVLSNAGTMAASFAPLGPWGMLAGAGLGAAKGLFDASKNEREFKKQLEERAKPRQVGTLGTSYNPEMQYGGNTQYQQAAERQLVDRIRKNPYNTYSSGPAMTTTGRLPMAGTETSYMPQMKNGGCTTVSSIKSKLRKMQEGGPIQNVGMGAAADVEIEGGEAVYSKNGMANASTLYGGATSDTNSSKGFMARGAKHGQTNEAGSEGIPMSVQDHEGNYVGSEKLGVDGRAAGTGNPSVAKTMEPYLKYLEEYENSSDKYGNNPKAMESIENELDQITAMAELGKAMKEMEKILKNRNASNIRETHDKFIEFLKEYPGKDDILTSLTGEPAGGDKTVEGNATASELNSMPQEGQMDPNAAAADPMAGMSPEEQISSMQGQPDFDQQNAMPEEEGMPGIPVGQGDAMGIPQGGMPTGRNGGRFRKTYSRH